MQISKSQLVLILKNIFVLKHGYEESQEEDASILIRLIHFIQLFEFIFIRFLKENEDVVEGELLNEIYKGIEEDDRIDISLTDLDSFVYDLNLAYYVPFLIWSNIYKIINNEIDELKIEKLLREFLLVSFDDYNIGILAEKKELWRYYEIILLFLCP